MIQPRYSSHLAGSPGVVDARHNRDDQKGGKKEKRKERRTNRVNDLTDHHLPKLKLLVFLILAQVLREHGHALSVVAVPRPDGVPVVVVVVVIVVPVESADTRPLSNAAVAMGAGAVVLPPEVQRLQEQQDRHLQERQRE